MSDIMYDFDFDFSVDAVQTAPTSRKISSPKFVPIVSNNSEDIFSFDENGEIDFSEFFESRAAKSSGPKRKRIHRNITIVLNERKPGGYDVFINPEFSTRGGRKVNQHGMETFESASRMAVELYRKIQFNQDTHKRKKSVTCDIVEEWDDTEAAPLERNRRPNYYVPSWTTKRLVKRDGEWVEKIERVIELQYEEVDGVTKVKIPRILQIWIAAAKRQIKCVSKNDFISIQAFENHAQLYWHGIDINQLGRMFAKSKGRKWSKQFARTFIHGCNRLHKSIRANLALQSIVLARTGRTTLPKLGAITIPSKTCWITPKMKRENNFIFDHEINTMIITQDSDGNIIPFVLGNEKKFEDNWSIEEVKVTGSNDKVKLACFKKKDTVEDKNPLKNRPMYLKDVPNNTKFKFMGRKFICVKQMGGSTVVLAFNEEKMVPSNLLVTIEE